MLVVFCPACIIAGIAADSCSWDRDEHGDTPHPGGYTEIRMIKWHRKFWDWSAKPTANGSQCLLCECLRRRITPNVSQYVQGSAKYRNSAKLKVSLNHTCCERGGWLCGSAWSAQIPGLIVACRTWPVDHALSAPCWGAGQGFMVKDWPGAALALHNAREANARIYLVVTFWGHGLVN